MKHLAIDNYSHLYSTSQFEMYQNLSLYLIPAKYWGDKLRSVYEEAFNFWQFHWEKSFSEININFRSTSEEFCHHENAIVLAYKGRVVCVALTDCFNLGSSVHRRHGYFTHYPEVIIKKLAQLSRGMPTRTYEYLAIAPEFRKNFALADISLGIALQKMFSETSSPLMTAYTRNTRRTNELMYRFGATCIGERLTVRGEDSDFVYFDRSNFETLKQHLQYPIIKYLWDKRIVDNVSQNHYENQIFKGELNEESYL